MERFLWFPYAFGLSLLLLTFVSRYTIAQTFGGQYIPTNAAGFNQQQQPFYNNIFDYQHRPYQQQVAPGSSPFYAGNGLYSPQLPQANLYYPQQPQYLSPSVANFYAQYAPSQYPQFTPGGVYNPTGAPPVLAQLWGQQQPAIGTATPVDATKILKNILDYNSLLPSPDTSSVFSPFAETQQQSMFLTTPLWQSLLNLQILSPLVNSLAAAVAAQPIAAGAALAPPNNIFDAASITTGSLAALPQKWFPDSFHPLSSTGVVDSVQDENQQHATNHDRPPPSNVRDATPASDTFPTTTTPAAAAAIILKPFGSTVIEPVRSTRAEDLTQPLTKAELSASRPAFSTIQPPAAFDLIIKPIYPTIYDPFFAASSPKPLAAAKTTTQSDSDYTNINRVSSDAEINPANHLEGETFLKSPAKPGGVLFYDRPKFALHGNSADNTINNAPQRPRKALPTTTTRKPASTTITSTVATTTTETPSTADPTTVIATDAQVAEEQSATTVAAPTTTLATADAASPPPPESDTTILASKQNTNPDLELSDNIKTCDGAKNPDDNTCYQFSKQKLNYADAVAKCRRRGGMVLARATESNTEFLDKIIDSNVPDTVSNCSERITMLGNWSPFMRYGSYAFAYGNFNNGKCKFEDRQPFHICLKDYDCTLVDWSRPAYFICASENTTALSKAKNSIPAIAHTVQDELCMFSAYTSTMYDYLVSCDQIRPPPPLPSDPASGSKVIVMPQFPARCVPIDFGDFFGDALTALQEARRKLNQDKISFWSSTIDPGAGQLQQCSPSCDDADAANNSYVICRREIVQNKPAPLFYETWRNAQVPYVFSDKFNSTEKATILRYMNEMSNASCLRFVEASLDTVPATFLHIVVDESPNSCRATVVGYVPGRVLFSLGPKCFGVPTSILRPLLQIAGIPAEQNRYDRDEHITVNFDNVNPSVPIYRLQYEKQPLPGLLQLRTPYDFHTVAHFPKWVYARRKGLNVFEISAKDEKEQKIDIDKNSGLSAGDKQKLAVLYGTKC